MSELSENSNATRYWPHGIGIFAFACAIAFQLACAFKPLEYLIGNVFERDDAYYYFLIAQNLAQSGVATFDGIHLSNGVQLLWTPFLSAIALIEDDRTQYLRWVLFLCVAFNVIAGALLYQTANRYLSRSGADIALLLFAGLLVERWNSLQGMEYSLHLAIIFATLTALHNVLFKGNKGWFFVFGVLLTLNYWTRLDSAIMSVALWLGVLVYAVRHYPRPEAMGRIVVMTVVPAIGAVGYVLLSYQWGETLLPISGAAKSYYAERYFEGTDLSRMIIEQVKMWIKINLQAFLVLFPMNILDFGQARLPSFSPARSDIYVLALPMVLVGTVFAALLFGRARNAQAMMTAKILAMVYFATLIHSAVSVWTLKDFSHVTRHYYGWQAVVWLLFGAMALSLFLRALPDKIRWPGGASVAVVAFVAYGLIGYDFLGRAVPQDDYAILRYRLAPELDELLPDDAVIGAWNAGAVGYFVNRPVINLDGLVNDAAFLEFLKSGAPIQEYLEQEGITHLVDHNERDLTLRFQESRDTVTEFRDGISWEEVEIVRRSGAIYVVAYSD